MKLLFDQNISFRIISKLEKHFPDCAQVRIIGLENCTDIEIWEHARNNNYTIVTFDTDFYDLSLIRGIPPKIIWLRLGNISTNNLSDKLIEHAELIREFLINKDYKDLGCLELDF